MKLGRILFTQYLPLFAYMYYFCPYLSLFICIYPYFSYLAIFAVNWSIVKILQYGHIFTLHRYTSIETEHMCIMLENWTVIHGMGDTESVILNSLGVYIYTLTFL